MIAVVGLGVSGSLLARYLAEHHFQVHCYESSYKLGGLAQHGNYALPLTDTLLRNYLAVRVQLVQVGSATYRPIRTWHDFCEELLFHPNISYLTSAPVWDIGLLTSIYQHAFVSSSPDVLCKNIFGELSYLLGIPMRSPEQVHVYQHYHDYVQKFSLTLFGYHGVFHYLTLQEAMLDALALGRAYSTQAIDTVETQRLPHLGHHVRR